MAAASTTNADSPALDGDAVDHLVGCGGAAHDLHGTVEAEQFGDQSIVDGVDAIDVPDAVRAGFQQANHRGAQQVCRRFVAGDGDDDRGGDDVVEFEVRVGADEAEQVVARMGAAVCGQRQQFGQQRGERGCSCLDSVGVGEIAEHSADRGRFLAQQSRGVDVQSQPRRSDRDGKRQSDLGHEVELDSGRKVIDRFRGDRLDASPRVRR